MTAEGLREIRRVPGAVQDELQLPSLTVTIPQHTSLSKLFRVLADAASTLHVLEYGVTQCTLEQIFVRMADKRGDARSSTSGQDGALPLDVPSA